jgi:hypothetical protein
MSGGKEAGVQEFRRSGVQELQEFENFGRENAGYSNGFWTALNCLARRMRNREAILETEIRCFIL